MLSTYLDSKETIDISLLRRHVLPDGLSVESSQSDSSAHQAFQPEEPPRKRQRKSRDALFRDQFDVLELDLDKSMAAITATQSPLAVLRTIEWAKKSRFAKS
jgi:hypothetical protein